MKKTISAFIALTALVTTTAFAAGTWGLGGEYVYFNGNSSTGDSNAFSIIPSYSTGRMVYDAKLQTARTTGNHVIYNSVEGRAKYTLPLGDKFSAALRGGYGGTYVESAFTQFYTIEPIVAYQINNKWSANASYQYLNGFGSGSPATDTWAAGADYNLTSNDVIGAQVKYLNDTFDGVGFQVGYNHTF